MHNAANVTGTDGKPRFDFHADLRDHELAKAVIAETLANGGGTFTRGYEPVDVSGRYVVGGKGNEKIVKIHDEFYTRDAVERGIESDEVERLAAILQKFVVSSPRFFHETYIGTWVHDGKLYLDQSELFTDRAEAERVGRERGEIAIFDGTTFEDITL